MLKEHAFLLKHVIAAADLMLLGMVFYYAHVVTDRYVTLQPLLDYWFMFGGFIVFYVYFAWTRDIFSVLQFPTMNDLARRVILIFAWAAVIGAATLYLIPYVHHSRRLYLTFVTLGGMVILTEKELLRLLLLWARRRGRNTTPLLILGRGRTLSAVLKRIRSHPQWGFRVKALLDITVPPEEFRRVLLCGHFEEVLLCIPRSLTASGFDIQPYVQICEEAGRPVRVVLNLPEATRFARWHYQNFLGRSSMVSSTSEADPDQLLFKRLFDICCALAGCTLFLILYPVIFLLVRMDSPGPVLVRRTCLGRNGKPFRMYSFRCTELENPRRLTRSGVLLRRLRLDHLPQFVNVLRGDLSVVGVRPTRPAEVLKYDKWHFRRLSCKPGMTGLWRLEPAISGSLDESVLVDLRYADSWTLWLDIVITARTVVRWLKGERWPLPHETGYWSGISEESKAESAASRP